MRGAGVMAAAALTAAPARASAKPYPCKTVPEFPAPDAQFLFLGRDAAGARERSAKIIPRTLRFQAGASRR
jgi:hypothetical protein